MMLKIHKLDKSMISKEIWGLGAWDADDLSRSYVSVK